jgi:hypothetical protein
VKLLHHFDNCNARTHVDELVCIRGIGLAARIGESVELRLTHLTARLAKEHVEVGV